MRLFQITDQDKTAALIAYPRGMCFSVLSPLGTIAVDLSGDDFDNFGVFVAMYNRRQMLTVREIQGFEFKLEKGLLSIKGHVMRSGQLVEVTEEIQFGGNLLTELESVLRVVNKGYELWSVRTVDGLRTLTLSISHDFGLFLSLHQDELQTNTLRMLQYPELLIIRIDELLRGDGSRYANLGSAVYVSPVALTLMKGDAKLYLRGDLVKGSRAEQFVFSREYLIRFKNLLRAYFVG